MSMAARTYRVSVTTAADGSATVLSPPLGGRLAQIHYIKTDFADGSTFTITSDATGQTLWSESGVNASTVRMPRAATHSTAGAGSLYAAGGTAVNDMIRLGRPDKVKIVIASGGNAKTGVFLIVMED